MREHRLTAPMHDHTGDAAGDRDAVADRRHRGAAHDDGALWDCWRRRRDRLWRLALRWSGGDTAEAEDALGDAVVRSIIKHRVHGASVLRLEPWLERLLHNVCVDRHRRRRLALDAARALAPEQPWVTAAPEHADLLRRLAAELDGLAPALRDALVARSLDGRDYDEIAAGMGITPANARKRVQLARAALRARVHGRGRRAS